MNRQTPATSLHPNRARIIYRAISQSLSTVLSLSLSLQFQTYCVCLYTKRRKNTCTKSRDPIFLTSSLQQYKGEHIREKEIKGNNTLIHP